MNNKQFVIVDDVKSQRLSTVELLTHTGYRIRVTITSRNKGKSHEWTVMLSLAHGNNPRSTTNIWLTQLTVPDRNFCHVTWCFNRQKTKIFVQGQIYFENVFSTQVLSPWVLVLQKFITFNDTTIFGCFIVFSSHSDCRDPWKKK